VLDVSAELAELGVELVLPVVDAVLLEFALLELP